MIKTLVVGCLIIVFVVCGLQSAVYAAADKKKTVEPPAAVESEAGKKWKSLKAQEEWVARLKKQIQGETSQLAEMRAALAKAFKLDVKKLESGLYEFNEKTGQFTEKKTVVSSQ